MFDFHSLRCQTATLLDASGVSPRVAQRLMRHSTPGLTDRYTRPRAVDLTQVALSLPSLRPFEAPQGAESILSATDGPAPPIAGQPKPTDRPDEWTGEQRINDRFVAHLPHAGDGMGQDLSHPDILTVTDEQPSMKPLEAQKTGLDASCRPVSDEMKSAPRRTRTFNPLIKSQLLCQLS